MTDVAPVPHVAPAGDVDPIRERLIAAAAEVFAEKGYEGAGVAEIARRAGYTTGAIYGRFSGKAELLLAAIEAHQDSELDRLFNEHQFEGKVTDILTTVGSHLVTDELGPNSALLLEAFMAARRDPEMARRVRESLDLRGDKLAELVTEAQATGAIDPSLDKEAVVRFCHALGFGFLLFRAIELDLPEPEPWQQPDLPPRRLARVASDPPSTADTDHHQENPEMTTNEEMLGRADVNDLEAILAITAKDADEMVHAVKDNADAIFTWDYEKGARPALNKLYEKAKGAQWNGETDLPWHLDVDPEKVAANAPRDPDADPVLVAAQRPGGPLHGWGDKEWQTLIMESQNWTMSQFMHGEQGALVCTAKIVETVPWIDAKYYAATQVMDEARHVEVFAKYLDTKMDGHYPLNAHLGMLLDDIIQDHRWDMTYLGMQIMVEGLALAAFGFMHMLTEEPLLKQLLRYVMSDEARHVAFGVLSLKEYYARAQRRGDARAPGVRLRGRRAHARPLPPAGGVGAHGRRRPHDGEAAARERGRQERGPVPAAPLQQDRAELQEARPPRSQRPLAPQEVR